MAGDRTTVTELVTGLGTLGFDDVGAALAARPPEMVSLSPEQWDLLDDLHRGGAYRQEFMAAWQNGVAFLAAADGLRNRRPLTVEWRGGQRQPGDEPVPADLRIDHVFLVSCKYLSRIVTNSSPSSVFDRLLAGGHGQGGRSSDWYAEVAPGAYQALYDAAVAHCRAGAGTGAPVGDRRAGEGSRPADPGGWLDGIGGVAAPPDSGGRLDGMSGAASPAGGGFPGPGHPLDGGSVAGGGAPEGLDDLPASAVDLTLTQRALLKRHLGTGRWAPSLRPVATEFSSAVAEASAARWRKALARADRERALWRLLRIGSAPYFVLGSGAERSLRLRIATAWDWRQHFRIVDFAVACGVPREQPVVEWTVEVAHRRGAQRTTVEGHVEIRWSHGKFAQPPEAKVYLDTPHHLIPGYWPLT